MQVDRSKEWSSMAQTFAGTWEAERCRMSTLLYHTNMCLARDTLRVLSPGGSVSGSATICQMAQLVTDPLIIHGGKEVSDWGALLCG